MPLTYWILFVDLLAFGVCLTLRTRASAWVLLVTSAAWLPANNKVLEGHTLFAVGRTHGVTQSDLLAVTGVLVATGLLAWRAGRGAPPAGGARAVSRTVTICAAVLGLGMLAALAKG